MVESCLAKAKVEGSIPFFRLFGSKAALPALKHIKERQRTSRRSVKKLGWSASASSRPPQPPFSPKEGVCRTSASWRDRYRLRRYRSRPCLLVCEQNSHTASLLVIPSHTLLIQGKRDLNPQPLICPATSVAGWSAYQQKEQALARQINLDLESPQDVKKVMKVVPELHSSGLSPAKQRPPITCGTNLTAKRVDASKACSVLLGSTLPNRCACKHQCE
ncbi:hypothetical protein AMTR_s04720p00001590 [Amborella trichopoda]|uniref:Uncharacterized protein n=1 Tax=Amborella trichopoda TaxID=13333 RepID=U5D086_AMBTC|nr:hypothetical protein AMTR_s04720p00001590 [Amborella trichopoda]